MGFIVFYATDNGWVVIKDLSKADATKKVIELRLDGQTDVHVGYEVSYTLDAWVEINLD